MKADNRSNGADFLPNENKLIVVDTTLNNRGPSWQLQVFGGVKNEFEEAKKEKRGLRQQVSSKAQSSSLSLLDGPPLHSVNPAPFLSFQSFHWWVFLCFHTRDGLFDGSKPTYHKLVIRGKQREDSCKLCRHLQTSWQGFVINSLLMKAFNLNFLVPHNYLGLNASTKRLFLNKQKFRIDFIIRRQKCVAFKIGIPEDRVDFDRHLTIDNRFKWYYDTLLQEEEKQ